jgi:hypothetical protein
VICAGEGKCVGDRSSSSIESSLPLLHAAEGWIRIMRNFSNLASDNARMHRGACVAQAEQGSASTNNGAPQAGGQINC